MLSTTVGTAATRRPKPLNTGTATLLPTWPYTTCDWIDTTSMGSGSCGCGPRPPSC
ncbi:Uncharacterised protein [Bordetella pertussis]|nr:Uncharacterised protein [Bordetella pertussis]